jgi:nucleoside phosphorylase
VGEHPLVGPIYRGRIKNIELFVSGAAKGTVGGAISSIVALRATRPTLVLMIGPCGGLKKETKLGDVVIANRAFHFQFGAFSEGKMQRELRSVDLHDRVRGLIWAVSASTFPALVKQIFEKWPEENNNRRPEVCPAWHMQPIASSDLFLKDLDKIQEAVNAERKVAAVDMEGYAFMRAAVHSGTPLGGIVVRTVGDFADDTESAIRHLDYANYSAAHFAFALLNAELSDLVVAVKGTAN